LPQNKNLVSLNEFIDKETGPKGTKKRAKFDAGYEAFKPGVLLRQARQEKGLT
jgi:HTH-type transcriptional regulator / antitoxin HipB